MYQIKINSTTGSELITNTDVKLFARIDTTADDDLLDEMITTARQNAENYLNSDIVAKNRTYYAAELHQRIELPFSPVASISSVTVDGSAATYTAYGLDNNYIELDSLPAEEVKITYVTSGLSDGLIKQALLQMVTTYYDNRADFSEVGNNISEIPTSSKKLLSPFKRSFI